LYRSCVQKNVQKRPCILNEHGWGLKLGKSSRRTGFDVGIFNEEMFTTGPGSGSLLRAIKRNDSFVNA
jgi:hypothetical protein